MGAEGILLGVACVLIAYVLASHRQQRDALKGWKLPGPAARLPSITVTCPIKGIDTGAAENVRAVLALQYPGAIEIIFVLDDESEPALPIVRDAIAEREREAQPPAARVIFCGQPPARRTGKLHAMMAALAEAQGELLAFVDSDTRPSPHAISRLVETLMGTSGAGAVFAPVVAPSLPQSGADAAYALMLNGLYSPLVALHAERHGHALPFIMGQCMVLAREALAVIGGLEAIEGELVDDMAIGAHMARAGLRNIMTSDPVPIVHGGLHVREFMHMFARWLAFSRTGLPGRELKWMAYQRALAFWLALMAAASGLAAGAAGWAVWVALLPAASVCWSNYRLHLAVGGATFHLRLAWVPAAVLLAGPFVLAWLSWKPRVSWRGRSYRLDDGWRLA